MANSGRTIGGGALVHFILATNNSPVVLGTTPIFVLDAEQVKTTISFDDATGAPTAEIEQIKNDGALQAFFESMKDYQASTESESLKLENGATIGGGSSSSTKVMQVIIKGAPVVGGTDNGKNPIVAFLATLSKGSGSMEQGADTYVRPSITLNGVEALGSVTIPSALLTNFASSTPATITIPATLKFGRTVFQ